MLNDTTDNIFTFFDYPAALKKAISTSNAIKSFNAKLETYKQGKELYLIPKITLQSLLLTFVAAIINPVVDSYSQDSSELTSYQK